VEVHVLSIDQILFDLRKG